MTQVRVKFTRDAPPYALGDEALFEESLALRLVVEFNQAVFCDTLTHPPIHDAPGPQSQDAAADAGPPSPPTSAAPARVVSMGGRRRR